LSDGVRHTAIFGRAWRTVAAWAGVMVLLTACGGDQEGPSAKQAQVYMNGLGGRGLVLRPGPDANALYVDAMALKAKGDCAAAIPKLRQVAGIGPGYEDAQTALGECLLTATKGSELSADYLEGLTWLRRAADAGWPEAQGRLAFAHAVGPAAIRNAEEAAYWLALYRMNTGKSRVGFISLPDDQLAAIDAAVPAAAKAAGDKRAETWERKVWLPPNAPTTPGPTSQQVKRREGMSRDNTPEPQE
jgi:TPR repeat protein